MSGCVISHTVVGWLTIETESQCSRNYSDSSKERGFFDFSLFSYFLRDSCNVSEWNFSVETQVSL